MPVRPGPTLLISPESRLSLVRSTVVLQLTGVVWVLGHPDRPFVVCVPVAPEWLYEVVRTQRAST
jgi:hypothetical protein